MSDCQKHGGPDGEGASVNADLGVALGHRRLALLDLSVAGQQPMLDTTGNFEILFNGEIYNYLEIRLELIALGYQFINQTDTEVILNAYIEWGDLAFEKLNGMFAVAIFDKIKKEIVLARDLVGIKPLYYHQSKQGLIFASEVKAFKESGFDFEEQTDWKIYFLSFGFISHSSFSFIMIYYNLLFICHILLIYIED
jgi:asparagine synthase (glutamine-hydrolysing)